MMNHRRLLALAVGAALVIGLTILLTLHPWDHPVPPTLASDQSLTYTNSITGESDSDLPQESGLTGVGQAALPGVTLGGTDVLGSYLVSDQMQTVVTAMRNFLAAKSGLSAVNAGIQDRQVMQSNNKLLFTLVADRPQAKYSVTVDISDALNPTITISEAK